MTSVVIADGGDQLVNAVHHLSVQDQDNENRSEVVVHDKECGHHGGVCAICLNKIVLQETALVKGCEHAYCVTCILRWASYCQKQTCPQCKHPFEFLNVHRTLDGSIQDYMFEESVCLLLRAPWFRPNVVEDQEYAAYDDQDDYYYPYSYDYEEEDEDDDLDEAYMSSSSHLRIGNRRWGDNGYVRAGRQEARPVHRPPMEDSGAGSSREPKKEAASAAKTGRRAKRTLKREAADRAAAAKHQQHLVRFGMK
ncbi:hypothetical protein Tsubulata_019690 [Turnera subulata]|uniref:RING-type domain-containing protein n=1 Tax=Turnera subulata TaxID=218843 RepID=A0A9Q0F1U5_9ROSI|nr:hypothetical protein Tsubulata_019690 [Turnera subulata]